MKKKNQNVLRNCLSLMLWNFIVQLCIYCRKQHYYKQIMRINGRMLSLTGRLIAHSVVSHCYRAHSFDHHSYSMEFHNFNKQQNIYCKFLLFNRNKSVSLLENIYENISISKPHTLTICHPIRITVFFQWKNIPQFVICS